MQLIHCGLGVLLFSTIFLNTINMQAQQIQSKKGYIIKIGTSDNLDANTFEDIEHLGTIWLEYNPTTKKIDSFIGLYPDVVIAEKALKEILLLNFSRAEIITIESYLLNRDNPAIPQLRQIMGAADNANTAPLDEYTRGASVNLPPNNKQKDTKTMPANPYKSEIPLLTKSGNDLTNTTRSQQTNIPIESTIKPADGFTTLNNANKQQVITYDSNLYTSNDSIDTDTNNDSTLPPLQTNKRLQQNKQDDIAQTDVIIPEYEPEEIDKATVEQALGVVLPPTSRTGEIQEVIMIQVGAYRMMPKPPYLIPLRKHGDVYMELADPTKLIKIMIGPFYNEMEAAEAMEALKSEEYEVYKRVLRYDMEHFKWFLNQKQYQDTRFMQFERVFKAYDE